MSQHHKINYIEIPVKDIEASKRFFSKVFSWLFVDYGPDYAGISGAGIDAGLFVSDTRVSTSNGSVLVVIYSANLEQSQQSISAHGGEIIKPVFTFPGGRRFHFCDPNGNEYAVWSDL
ncbi:MAG: putative enzyme related to lactoylglutathione lyase [Paraglaciecola sp.]|jgi:predicted enzyme related to lactoylglutathione lyase